MSTLTGYLAFPGHLEALRAELVHAGFKSKKMILYGDLILLEGPRKRPVWARNIWSAVERIPIESIADASRKLKAMGLRWAVYPHLHRRRAGLILKNLREVASRPFHFPTDRMPEKPLGSFLMISNDEILASAHCSQTVPNGDLEFVEDKLSPPTRAYLKLWEAFTRIGKMPKAGDQCFDLGSCPGGWTWVLARLNANVVSVDRSPIDPAIHAMPGVKFIQGNAFTLDPAEFPRADWIFSDVICEPARLLELVRRWLSVHPRANFICSVKFKGDTDFRTLNALLQIPGSSVRHLNHNKNEVTWARILDDTAS